MVIPPRKPNPGRSLHLRQDFPNPASTFVVCQDRMSGSKRPALIPHRLEAQPLRPNHPSVDLREPSSPRPNPSGRPLWCDQADTEAASEEGRPIGLSTLLVPQVGDYKEFALQTTT